MPPNRQLYAVCRRHEELIAAGVGIAFDPGAWKTGGVSGGFDDALVEDADKLACQVILNRHPQTFLDFLLLHGDRFAHRRETADKVDVGLAPAIAMPMAETDHTLELGFYPRFFQHFAHHGIG